jgi:hypothetical protein
VRECAAYGVASTFFNTWVLCISSFVVVRMSDDDDDEAIWAACEDETICDNVAMSENLALPTNRTTTRVVHKGDPDEGRPTWEPPAVPGLRNSPYVRRRKGLVQWRHRRHVLQATAAPKLDEASLSCRGRAVSYLRRATAARQARLTFEHAGGDGC